MREHVTFQNASNYGKTRWFLSYFLDLRKLAIMIPPVQIGKSTVNGKSKNKIASGFQKKHLARSTYSWIDLPVRISITSNYIYYLISITSSLVSLVSQSLAPACSSHPVGYTRFDRDKDNYLDAELRGRCPKSWGYPSHPAVMEDHDLRNSQYVLGIFT